MARPRKHLMSSGGSASAADVIAFIETVCFVPEGKLVGQPLRLQPWQRDILRAIYDNPAGTRRAIIRNYIRPRSRATRPRSFSAWRAKW